MENRRFTFLLLGIVLTVGAGLAFGSHAFAQTVDPTSGLDTFAEAAGFSTQGDLTLIIARLIRTAISFLGVIAVVMVLYGGFLFMTASGSEDKVKRAKRLFTSALIGLVIVLSAFAIVQFILSQLTSALSGGSPGGSSGPGGIYVDGGNPSSQFSLTSVNTDCAEAMMNLQLQFTFSQRVSSTSVEADGILVKKGGVEVDGTYEVSGKRVTFTPAAACESVAGEYCFDASTEYTITLDASVLESTTGKSLTCSSDYPCSYAFTTGTAVDTEGPDLSMDAPDNGASVYANDIELLQALATDDTGVSSVDFTVDGDTVYQAALSTDSTEGALAATNYFYTADGTQWDTSGFSTGSYAIRAKGSDCAGHSDTSSSVTVVLRPAHCANGIEDEDETGEDCGGDDCGSCDGESCASDDDCSSGYCDEDTGECVGVPKIEDISPGDGAGGNLVTISGSNFGATADSVTFLGDESTTADDVVVSAYECNSSTQWSDEEIIVQIDSSMTDGPVLVETSDGYADQTNDDYGPTISDFDVNGVERPGICMLDPDTDVGNSPVEITGNNFGSSQGTSTVYFTNYEASDYGDWSNDILSAVVPLLNARSYRTQVWAGDYQCVTSVGASTGTTCSTDDDCATDEGESCATKQCSESGAYCDSSGDCSGEDESCVSLRQGSNKVTFTVEDASAGETPVISQVVTGWEACSNDDSRCGEDSDCTSGTCDSADNWGPPGQYVTIYGSAFGTSTGTVVFTGDLGYANGDTTFPDACGDDMWDDTEITVKVPSEYQTGDAIDAATYSLTIETALGATSEGVEFVILDDEPGPGICSMEPSSGPAGTTTITLDGDNFGNTHGSGYVEYYNGQDVSDADYWNNSQIQSVVDADASTGPVFVVTNNGYESNTVNFEVGDCREDAALCGTGEECCGDGTCSAECVAEVAPSHYAWMFSTGDIPATPKVSVFCGDTDGDGNYDGVSPGPWERWSIASDICVNASVTATFTTIMDQDSFEGNVSVQTCDGEDSKDPCANLDDGDDTNDGDVEGSIAATDEYAFEWDPDENFKSSTTYRVTLDSTGIKSAAGAYLARDYSWEFTTSSSTDLCEVGQVYVSPSKYTATAIGTTCDSDDPGCVDYSATPISDEDECVPLQCTSYAWNWDVSDSVRAELIGNDLGETDACENTARALEETSAGTPVEIEAGPDDVHNDPTDTGDLTINFTDPEVTSWEPSCSTACLNAGLRAEFNAAMTESDFVAGDTVSLYVCEDSLCDSSEVEDFSGTYSVSYPDDDTYVLTVSHDDFAANTWYRVVLSGDVESVSGVALSESGSNYGSDANRYYSDDFSWTFKTKDSDVPCAIDRVEVAPAEASATVIGEQTLFEAMPYGAPDDCSASGQLLDATDYSWDAWTATDAPNVAGTTADVAEMVSAGALHLSYELEDGCSSRCLHTGSSVTIDDAVCGDGDITYGEECDGGSGCTDECLDEGSEACSSTVTSGCCGDGVLDSDEECDDGNTSNTDGCSSVCLNAGSSKAGTTCGDSITDQSSSTGGEDCDDGNTSNDDGCSSVCLYEGGREVSGVFATCGNGSIEDGEDCDEVDADDGDGCSSSCLFEGASACAYECYDDGWTGENCSGVSATTCSSGTCLARSTPCCGDLEMDYDGDGHNDAEDCEDGNTTSGDGCSSSCLNEGSSVSYDDASYCGDGDVGMAEECEAPTTADFNVDNFGISVIKSAAPQDVLNGKAGAEISAASGSNEGTAALSLSCSCNSDDSCGNESAYGCGTGSCCFERPKEYARYPISGATDVCRNTSVYVDFTQTMDEGSLDPSDDLSNPNLYLELVSMDGSPVDSTNCPEGYTDATLAFSTDGAGAWIGRVWQWVVGSVRSLFGRPATAATYACIAPVRYSLVSNDVNGSRVSLGLTALLEANSQYRFVIVEDSDSSDATDEGVLSAYAVGIVGPSDGTDESLFYTGSEVCELEKVVVEDLGLTAALTNDLLDPSAKYFTENGEEHTVQAAAYTVRGGSLDAIAEIPAVYEWSLGWDSTKCDDESDDACADNIVDMIDADATQTTATAEGNTGRETIVATASFASTNTFGDASGGVSGGLQVTANVCDNPPTVGFPYEDTVSNFSFSYCRDVGDETTDDDLPELGGPIDVTSYSTDFIQEIIFRIAGTSDAIGVRVLKNEFYLSPSAWYSEQGFTGTTTEASLDGYDAVRDGNTIYVAAANHDGDSDFIYPNVYVISYTQGASDEAQNIFDQILSNWKFNSNDDVVTDVNVCVKDGAYATQDGALVSCAWDGDCLASVGSDYVCDADKAKLTRDMRRLSDVTYLNGLLEDYGDSNGACSVTTNQVCVSDSECPGDETCEPAVPTMSTGTFVRSYSTSTWPSWASELGNDFGTALPEDPVNGFYACDDDGYESATCWSATAATFMCPEGSHVYGYRSVGGTSYALYAQLEYAAGLWAFDLVPSLGTNVVEQAWMGATTYMADGFSATPVFCKDETVYGESAICGDGVVGSEENCEVGETISTDSACDTDGDGIGDGYPCASDSECEVPQTCELISCESGSGTIPVTCEDDCKGFQSVSDVVDLGASCVAYECGNGVLESDNGEECDDGSLNGSYGHCGDDCTLDTAFYCGDGYLAGGESCDCGETSNFTSVMADTASWAAINTCLNSNGQWTRNPAGTCAWDCTSPGPSCGDGEVNGAEQCDGDSEEWDGALCTDQTTCSVDSDCSDGSLCGSGGTACGIGSVCEDSDDGTATDVGEACTSGSTCDSGSCSSFTYELTRTRTCQTSGSNMCDWNTWSGCASTTQYCGNGTTEGDEACDDGNALNTDVCTNDCALNVCGDDYVYSGVESCDDGSENGDGCDPDYDSTCNYCSSSCTYKTSSGAYCGDGTINGSESCDGAALPGYCIDTSTGVIDVAGKCDAANKGTSTGCEDGYTCHLLGACNGGTKNGSKCLYSFSRTDPDINRECTVYGGTCVTPTCADDCSSMCPLSFETVSVVAQTEAIGADASDTVELYSYLSGNSPDNATFFLPACTVGTELTADINTDGVTLPSMDVVFVTDLSGSMAQSPGGSTSVESPYRRIDYVVEATSEAVENLFDFGVEKGISVQIGLTSFSTDFRAAATSDFCNEYDNDDDGTVDGASRDGGNIDAVISSSSSESTLLSIISSYATECVVGESYGAGTSTYAGLELAYGMLAESTADKRMIVLLADGAPNYNSDFRIDGDSDDDGAVPPYDECADTSYSYGSLTYTGTSACIAEAADLLTGDTTIQVYTATISTADSSISYINHLSSEECGWSSAVSDVSSDVCTTGTYAFSAESADGISEMYDSIFSGITGLNMNITTETDGVAQVTSGSLSEGQDNVLPFPENFECSGSEMGVPFTVTFNGDGYIALSDISFTYCPAP